jgi:hypothetical protein
LNKFSPAHYQQGSIETWDFIIDQQLGYLEGNIIKYITRAGKKNNESKFDDLLKAQAYIHKLVLTEINATTSTRPDESSRPVSDDNGATCGGVHPGCFGQSTDSDN